MDLGAYAQVALTAVERRALYLHDVDWPSLRNSTLTAAADAGSVERVHDLLRDAVQQVGGPHSRLLPPDAVPPFDAATQELPTARVIGDIGVLTLPSCRGTTEAVRAYARAGAHALHAVPPVRAWVVDLRTNRGGSMWPMLAVAAPLLGGDGTLGSFTTRDGKRIKWWLRRGWVGAGWHPSARSKGPRHLPGLVA
ncbi:S41 family peptidase, partial [Kineococcus arenarius]|uniref:S41 family peptidase n=1 Tax=unclassified Kineococcus TaxID=2621656 RepID=UPI003D7E3F6F